MENLVRKTTSADRKLAKEIMELLGRHAFVELRAGRKSVKLSAGVVRLLNQIFSLMANGKSLAVLASETEVSTQEAAQLLNCSRPYVVKLLEEGKIPSRKVGKHRRMRLSDVFIYKRKQDKRWDEGLTFLAQQAQDLKWGYE
jgi:excisionase family DNA binding protein